MSYHIYTTDGIVLKRTPFGEANILLHILTEDLGLIIASARSVRLSVSKLKNALQDYSYLSVSCIKGKNGWKITNVVDKGNFFFEYPEYLHSALAHTGQVLLKMISGETPQKEIFEIVRTGFIFLKELKEDDVESFEALVVLRILYELGYVSRDEDSNDFLVDGKEWNLELMKKIKEKKIKVVGVINKALKESHL